jgi:transcriptional regulator with GAF, ATPase, and Fis domain
VPPPATSAREHLLHELGTAFAARLELDELIPLVVRRCPEALDAEGASVLLLDDGGTHLHFPYVAAEAEVARRLAALRIPADRGVAGAVAEVDRATGFTTRAIMCVPLRGRSDVLGVLQVVNPRHRAAFDDAELRFLDALAGSVAVALENARLFAAVRDSASRLHEQVGALRRDVVRLERESDLLGTAPSLDEVRRLMDSAAASPITVLIEGETGTGKELVARGIHRASVRGEHPFVAVNCAALT